MGLILASASPRRRELLDQLGVAYTCDPAAIDETQHVGEHAAQYVERMARHKAATVAARHAGAPSVVLAADTCVVLDATVLGKPADAEQALAMLLALSGRRHTVLTAVCVHTAHGPHSEVVATEVEFATLEHDTCAAYLLTNEPWDKAGGYAIQGVAGAFVRSITGSYSNVVGLPLYETWQLLRACGIRCALTPTVPA